MTIQGSHHGPGWRGIKAKHTDLPSMLEPIVFQSASFGLESMLEGLALGQAFND